MEFCIISPIAGLERYSTLSKTHLLLPQLDKLPGYREFYLKRKEAGDFLILDNGAYEGIEDWKLLVDCISIYKPQVVALPDYMLGTWDKTFWEAQRFLDSYYDQFPWVQWMYIPQAIPGDIIGWVTSLEMMLRDERVKWIGLARVLTYAITSDPMMRVNCARAIHRMWPHIKMHALGMSKGSVEELNELRARTSVYSIDSNAPVWRGECAYSIDPKSYLYVKQWPETPCEYERPLALTGQTDELILSNLEVCGVNVTDLRQRDKSQRETTPRS